MIALIASIGVAAVLVLSAVRLLAGPTLHDRLLAANAVGVKVCVICAAAAVAANRSDWLDVSLALAFALLTVNAAAAKFFRTRSFQPPIARAAEERR